MRVVLADSLGMCFGVRDALDLALQAPYRNDLTVLGDLVHNPDVLRRLEAAGIRTVRGPDAEAHTPYVMITAHGAAPSVISRLRADGKHVLEATCPLVAHAHRMLDRLVSQGYFPVVIGSPDHVEVRGLVQDLPDYRVLPGPEEIRQLAGHPRLGIVSQTTQTVEFVLDMVRRVRAAFPDAEVRFADTICQPTKERQLAARRLAAGCQVVVVVGGRNSNNTRLLVRTCASEGARTYQVERPEELRSEWFAGADVVGITAGTSTPDEMIAAVRRAVEFLGQQGSAQR